MVLVEQQQQLNKINNSIGGSKMNELRIQSNASHSQYMVFDENNEVVRIGNYEECTMFVKENGTVKEYPQEIETVIAKNEKTPICEMTRFESLCKELGIEIEIDKKGFYNGMCNGLATICNKFIFDETNRDFTDDDIKARFFKVFPYWEV